MIVDTKQRYGLVSRLFHWGVALLVLWQVMKIFDRINDGEHWVGQNLVPWHVSIGSLLLVLIVLRIVWALGQHNNRPEGPPPPLLGILAKTGHFLLYCALVLMPLSGMSYLIGSGYALNVFGVELIAAGPEIPWLASFGGSVHSPLAWLLVIMLIGHIGMALFHHFVRKDGVLRRML